MIEIVIEFIHCFALVHFLGGLRAGTGGASRASRRVSTLAFLGGGRGSLEQDTVLGVCRYWLPQELRLLPELCKKQTGHQYE